MKKRYGLLGEHLSHSFSPAIHAQLGDYRYELFERRPEEVSQFLQSGDFAGLNVTMPYKKTVMAFCQTLTPAAQAIGCVNTIVRQADGTLLGDNTDYAGFRYMLRSAGAQVAGKRVLVLGSGGASLTVRAVLRDLGAGEIVTISRRGRDNYETLHRHADAQIVVNATPVGMYPNTGVAPVNLDRFPRCEGVFDLIYNPARTRLLLDAERRGILCCNGLGMLVAQAKAAAERFLDRHIPDFRVDEIAQEMERQTRNLLLVGMPGCGKSTVARALAHRLHRPLVDIDHVVEERCGCSIPELFAREGEESFRRLEHEVIADVCRQSGLVIATGGGAVTRRENHDPICQNSFTVYLRRDLELLPMSGRPISLSTTVQDLYAARAPLYEALSDIAADNVTVDEAVSEIIGRLQL